jgi:hypothetical protein
MAEVRNIKMTVSGVYAQVRRRADDWQDAMLNRMLPRWDYLTSGSYVEIDPDHWRELLAADVIDERGRCGKIVGDRGRRFFARPSSVPYATAFDRTAANSAQGFWFDSPNGARVVLSVKPAGAVY